MRYILVSDIHGCSRQFKELLAAVQYSDNDQLILCGDLFDRGADSYGVYEEVRRQTESRVLPPIIIRGNHEQMLFDVYTDVSGKMGRLWYNTRLWYAIVGHTPLRKPIYCDGSGKEERTELPYGEWIDLPETGLIAIDTGGVFGGAFTAAIIEDEKIRFEKIKG